MTIEFGCFDDEYPTTLCTLDTLGDVWHIDGQYQRQQTTFNEHPVYRVEGYSYLLPAVYLFLHDGNGTDDWRWTFTLDSNLTDDYWIEAKCSEGAQDDPSQCPSWNVTHFYTDSDHHFTAYSHLNVTDGFCAASDSNLCLDSAQSNLGEFWCFCTLHIPNIHSVFLSQSIRIYLNPFESDRESDVHSLSWIGRDVPSIRTLRGTVGPRAG